MARVMDMARVMGTARVMGMARVVTATATAMTMAKAMAKEDMTGITMATAGATISMNMPATTAIGMVKEVRVTARERDQMSGGVSTTIGKATISEGSHAHHTGSAAPKQQNGNYLQQSLR